MLGDGILHSRARIIRGAFFTGTSLMWDWRPGDEIRAHRYAMKHAEPEEFAEYDRLLDRDFDEFDLIEVMAKLVAA